MLQSCSWVAGWDVPMSNVCTGGQGGILFCVWGGESDALSKSCEVCVWNAACGCVVYDKMMIVKA